MGPFPMSIDSRERYNCCTYGSDYCDTAWSIQHITLFVLRFIAYTRIRGKFHVYVRFIRPF
jgi:hypothetical protein